MAATSHEPLPNKNSTTVLLSGEPGSGTPVGKAVPPGNAGVASGPDHRMWHERLPDGGTLLIRPIRPEDAAGLRAGFGTLTGHDVRMRFFRPLSELNASMADYLTHIDHDRHEALVALASRSRNRSGGWGVARYVADPDYRRAEFAIVVRSDAQRHGIGSLLIARLIACATARGIAELRGDVLAENTAMLAFAKKHGFRITRSPEGPSVLRASKRLDGAAGESLPHPFT